MSPKTNPKVRPTPHQGLVQVYTGDGKGKCVSADTWILTASGLSTTGNLAADIGLPIPGTFTPISLNIATHDGISCARALYNGGVTETKKILTRFGYELEGTPQHPVLSLTPDGMKWQRLSKMKPGAYVAIARGHDVFGTKYCTLDKAYLAGLLLGDGYIVAKKRYWRIILTSKDSPCIETWRSYLAQHGLQFKTYPSRPNDYRISGKAEIQKIIKDLWLAPKGAAHKEIDPRWLACNRETVRALLQGLFDSDGSAYKPNAAIEFSSASERLAHQVHLLLLNFGIIAKRYAKKTKRLMSHRILIRGAEARIFFEKIGFRLSRKQAHHRFLPTTNNPNVDVVPFTWQLLRNLPLSLDPAPRTSVKGPTPFLKKQFWRKTRFYRERGIKASYNSLFSLLNHPAVIPSPEKNALLKLCQLNYFWDQVIAVKPDRTQVLDFCVPDKNSFIANGFVCHNTTAALGLGLRAAGHGFQVYMIQFMKGQINYGELEAVKHLPNFTIRQFGRPEFVDRTNPDPQDIEFAKAALQHAREIMEKGNVDFLILDEVNCAIDWGLIPEEEVIDLIQKRPANMELVLTGRYARPAIMELADLVSEIKEIKHPYQKGISARKGCEM